MMEWNSNDFNTSLGELDSLIEEYFPQNREQINKIASETIDKIKKLSAFSLPERPSESGMKPDQIKMAFYMPIVAAEISIVAEINRIVSEANITTENSIKFYQELNEVMAKLFTEMRQFWEDSRQDIQTQIGDLAEKSEELEGDDLVTLINYIAGNWVKKVEPVDGKIRAYTDAAPIEISSEADKVTIAQRDLNGALKVGTPTDNSHATTKEYVDDNFVGKNGNQVIDGELAVKSLVVTESFSSAEVESIRVKESVIVANADGVHFAGVYGYVIRINETDAYGIVYNPNTGSLEIGLGTYTDNTEAEGALFEFKAEEHQKIATRGDIADGNIPVWDGEKYTFKDSGKSAKDVVTSGGITDGHIPVWDGNTKRMEDSGKKVSDLGAIDAYSNALKGNKSGEAIRLDDVSPIEHDLVVKVSGVDNPERVKLLAQGKNSIPYPYTHTTRTENGVTFTDNGDGSLTIDGIATANVVFYLYYFANNNGRCLIPKKEFVLSGILEKGYENGYCMQFSYITSTDTKIKYSSDNGKGCVGGADYMIKSLYISVRQGFAFENITIYPQLELGLIVTDYEPYIKPTEYSVNADGSVSGVKSIFPCTTLMTDTEGVLIECEYNRDINKALAELQQAIILLGGQV